jgi:hypothetical protein
MKITIEIELGPKMQSAEDVETAISDALFGGRTVAILNDGSSGVVLDENDNRVGRWVVSDDPLNDLTN